MKIVIVGGGTAGWLAALSIVKAQPNQHNVVLIQSQEIPIVGAGEGSTQLLHDFVTNKWFDTGIKTKEFIEKCNVTPKMGILHENWTNQKTKYFAPLDGSSTSGMAPDTEFCRTLIHTEKFHLASNIGKCYENKRICSSSYHFDAHLISKYFSEIAKNSGVLHIQETVFGVGINENEHIYKVTTKEGSEIYGDFFIDCTGFNRTLAGSLNMKWKSYKKELPVDSALSFNLPIDNTVRPYTIASAKKYGWMWKIPTSKKFGLGYVYSSNFVNDSAILSKIYELYGKNIEIKKHKFESGRSIELWKNNCLTLGLSAAFAEPLEATSIHSTIMQTMIFVMEYLGKTKEETINELSIKNYNNHLCKMYDDFKDFLQIHYMGGRNDSEFWNYMNNENIKTENTKRILNICKNYIPSSLSIDNYFGCAGIMLYNWILAGMGIIGKRQAINTLTKYNIPY